MTTSTAAAATGPAARAAGSRLLAQPVRTAGRALPTTAAPLVPVPRTTTARPWDRARFAAVDGRAIPVDDGAPLAEVIPLGPVLPADDPATWCGTLVRAAVEALAGCRPAAQLARWLSADVYESLARRAGLAVRVNGRPVQVRQTTIRRVHVCRLDATTAEAAVVVHDGERVRAAAVRIEAFRGRWRATAFEIG